MLFEPRSIAGTNLGLKPAGIFHDRVENTAAWTDSLPPGEMRDAARARVVWDLGKEDLGTAATWVEGFSHEKDAGLAVEAMAKVWASQDILGSVTWLESLEASGAKRKGLSAAYGYWGALEPESASLPLPILVELKALTKS